MASGEEPEQKLEHFYRGTENLVGLGFLQSVSYIKSIPTREKNKAVGKKWLECHF